MARGQFLKIRARNEIKLITQHYVTSGKETILATSSATITPGKACFSTYRRGEVWAASNAGVTEVAPKPQTEAKNRK